MNIAFIILLFAALCRAENSIGRSSDFSCNSIALATCDAIFKDQLNIPQICGWHDPLCLQKGLEDTFALGRPNGLPEACSAFNNFENCLGSMEPLCINMFFFIKSGIKPEAAKGYVSDIEMLRYACGDGKNTFLQHDTCMSRVFGTQREVLDNCRDQFRTYLQAPQLACEYSQNLTSCFQSTFSNACGEEAGNWACEYARTYAQVYIPPCIDNCKRKV